MRTEAMGMSKVPRIDEQVLGESEREHPRDVLAKDEPMVLESSETDPEFPAMEEFEVDADGPRGSRSKHPGLIWAIIAIVAVIVLCLAFASAGDWATPDQAERIQQTQENEQIVPEDLGEN